MEFNTKRLWLTRLPMAYEVSKEKISLTTRAYSDLWQGTGSGEDKDNAPLIQMTTEEQNFTFTVKADFAGYSVLFDQCGVVMYLDKDCWLKAAVEYENETSGRLVTVVTNHGWSDCAIAQISGDIRSMWYRLHRRNADFCVECSEDGVAYRQIRIFHIPEAAESIKFGMYACSPGDSSFEAVFTEMQMTECSWVPYKHSR